MAIVWNYKDEGTGDFGLLPAGDYRVRISDVEERKTRSGMDAINITLDVSGKNSKLFYWLNFDMQNASLTNQKLNSIYDSFGIQKGNLNFQSWVGKVGACRVRHTNSAQYGEQANVHYFMNKKQAETLPAWQENGTEMKTTEVDVDIDLPPLEFE